MYSILAVHLIHNSHLHYCDQIKPHFLKVGEIGQVSKAMCWWVLDRRGVGSPHRLVRAAAPRPFCSCTSIQHGLVLDSSWNWNSTQTCLRCCSTSMLQLRADVVTLEFKLSSWHWNSTPTCLRCCTTSILHCVSVPGESGFWRVTARMLQLCDNYSTCSWAFFTMLITNRIGFYSSLLVDS